MNSPNLLEWVASISTGAAVIVALGGYGFLEWQRRQSVRASRRASAHMIGIRLFRISNATGSFEQHFKNYSLTDPEQRSVSLLPPVHPLVGVMVDTVGRLDKDEIALLIEAKEASFLTELMLANAVYEATVNSLNEYRDRYEALYKMLPPPTSIKGLVGKHELTGKQLTRLKPYSNQLFDVIDALRNMISENGLRCENLSRQYHPMMKRRFKGEKFISLGRLQSPEPGATN